MTTERPRFLADAMLHGLARWLRVLGYDTSLYPGYDDPALVDIARQEDRILLTRDHGLVEELKPPRYLFIETDKPLRQLREVIDACALTRPDELFTRCLVCNTPVRDATGAEKRTLFPDSARELPGPFRRCPNCGRAYWPGTHTRRMRELLAKALPGWFGGGDA